MLRALGNGRTNRGEMPELAKMAQTALRFRSGEGVRKSHRDNWTNRFVRSSIKH